MSPVKSCGIEAVALALAVELESCSRGCGAQELWRAVERAKLWEGPAQARISLLGGLGAANVR